MSANQSSMSEITPAHSGDQRLIVPLGAASCRSRHFKNGRLTPTQQQARSGLIGSRCPRGRFSLSQEFGDQLTRDRHSPSLHADMTAIRQAMSSARSTRRRFPSFYTTRIINAGLRHPLMMLCRWLALFLPSLLLSPKIAAWRL